MKAVTVHEGPVRRRPEPGLAETALACAVDGILTTDEEGLILSANPAIERIFGYPLGELIGQNVQVLMPVPYHEGHDRYHGDWRATSDPEAIGIRRPIQGRTKDGLLCPLELTVGVGRSGGRRIYTKVLRDFTEHDPAAELIRRACARSTAVLDGAVDSIITIDADGIIQSANAASQRAFGYRLEELLGQSVRMLVPASPSDEFNGRLANRWETDAANPVGIGHQVECLCKDGRELSLDLVVSKADTEDGVIFTGILRDISHRIKDVELQCAKDASDKASAAKSEFLSRMSHELRTPLTAVLGFAQVLHMRYDDPIIQDATQSIVKAGQHLLSLINEILDLSRIEEGMLTTSMEPVKLLVIVMQAVDLVNPLANKESIEIRVHGEADGTYVMADRQRLLQILINLLSNAIKFNRPQGQVDVSFEVLPNGRRRIVVADSGAGISSENRERLFQPFERFGDLSIDGTGLGLVLSRRFAEFMNGSLVLMESSSSGSKFALELEGTDSVETRSIGLLGLRHREPTSRVRPGSVLYIEDNLSNMKLVEMILQSLPQIELIPALQGQVGIDLARTRRPDLILLDIHLPDMSGPEVLHKLKEDARTSKIPVVVISADATPSQVRRLHQGGAYDYMTKPLDVDLFIRLFEEVFAINKEVP